MSNQADIENGGPAFPRSFSEDRFNEESYPAYRGMTLRDWFAGQALCGLMSDPTIERLQPEGYAKASYDYADAMIQARKA